MERIKAMMPAPIVNGAEAESDPQKVNSAGRDAMGKKVLKKKRSIFKFWHKNGKMETVS